MPSDNADETIIDFNKAIKAFTENKKTIFLCFLICMSTGALFNFALPKKYTSEAKILIKKTASTNLSYINPYTIADNPENENFSSFIPVKSSLNEEIEILKSPLVLDITVKENNLRYQNGPAEGKYLTAKDFLRKNFEISKLKDADIIYIAYKSKNPVLSYNVLNSVINNYKKLQTGINTEKASDDTVFLKKAYLKAERALNFKVSELKKYKNLSNTAGIGPSSADFTLMSFYDKRLNAKLKQISSEETAFKKLESEISEKSEELNDIKNKLDRSSLVKEMSKNATDLIVLQAPEIKEKYDFSEPNPVVIFILSLIGWIVTSFMTISFIYKDNH